MRKRIVGSIMMFFLLWQLAYFINVTPSISQHQWITVPDDYPTIQEGIDHAETGSTVYVRNGTYTEHLTVNKSLTVVGENPLAVVINATVNPIGIYVSADFVTIMNFTIMSNDDFGSFTGIELYRSRHCTLTQNKITTLGLGIVLQSSNGNTISYNTLSEVYHIYGISLYDSNKNIIVGNYAKHNDGGLFIYGGGGNFVASNTFFSSWGPLGLRSGVHIDSSSENVLVKNNIYGLWGLEIENSQDIEIYHNSIGGEPHFGLDVYLLDVINVSWDAGYPEGGNYWLGYNGSDDFRGFFQNESGSDGIGDMPYILDVTDLDHYPLMQAYSAGSRDIGIADVNVVKQVFGHQSRANVTISIVNFGDDDVVTNVTIRGNSTVIEVFNATLLGGTVSAITFVWNTTDLVHDNYDVLVSADAVGNETDTTDNELAYGVVYFSVPGDVNADGLVNILDAILLSSHFNEDSFNPNWNMNVDFNGDGRINILDALILASNYGRTVT